MMVEIPYSNLTAEQKLRALWHVFCDADPVPPEFVDEMEAAGFATLRPVTKDDLEESFAAERGIEAGGSVWVLTAAGQLLLDATQGGGNG